MFYANVTHFCPKQLLLYYGTQFHFVFYFFLPRVVFMLRSARLLVLIEASFVRSGVFRKIVSRLIQITVDSTIHPATIPNKLSTARQMVWVRSMSIVVGADR